MADALSRWRGKQVTIVYANSAQQPIQGKLIDVDGAGIVIDLPEGRAFVPYATIYQVIVPQDGA